MKTEFIGSIKSGVISDIIALITLPFIFAWCIFHSYGIYGFKFNIPFIALFIGWIGYFFLTQKGKVLPITYKVVFALVSIIFVSNLINSYLLWKQNALPDTNLMYFLYIDVAVFVIACIVYLRKKEQFVLGMHMASCFVLITGLYGYYDYFKEPIELILYYRPFSIYGNPIPAGNIFLIFLWIPLFPKDSRVPVLKKLDSIIRILVYVPFIFLTQSRSIWLGLAFSVIVWVICNWKEFVRRIKEIPSVVKIAGLVVALIGFCMSFSRIYNIILVRFLGVRDTQPYRLRINYIKYTVQKFMESSLLRKLFGYGAATSRNMIVNSPYLEDMYDICDNAYFSMLYEWGIISIIAVMIVDILAFILIKRAGKKLHDDMSVRCSYVIIACIIPTFFYDVQMWYMVTAPILFCVPAVLAGYGKESYSVQDV